MLMDNIRPDPINPKPNPECRVDPYRVLKGVVVHGGRVQGSFGKP